METTSSRGGRQLRARLDPLSRPEAYRAVAFTETVRLIETHVSRVYVLDRDVFKIKKAIDVGFLDFRDLERRRVACEAEVSLNRRLAPQVYLGVVPVCVGEDGEATVGGSGSVVDWAVHMVRLDDGRSAEARLASGALTAHEIDEIALKIAKFHASASEGARSEPYARSAGIARNVCDNFTALSRLSGSSFAFDARRIAELRAWQLAFVRAHADTFEARIASGRVRDGHGDLRLEHVYLDDRANITIIDCIEFADSLRIADVAADVAFFAMDLTVHGHPWLAERFLATYARAAIDFDMYALIDFYESYRAVVRAKVLAMRAGQASATTETVRAAHDEARRHLDLACSFIAPRPLRPVLVAVAGHIASGKSTVAEHLGKLMAAPVIDGDGTRKAMLGLRPTEPLHFPAWQGPYDAETTARAYAELRRMAGIVLASGRSVVLDASFRSMDLRRSVRELARACGAAFRLVECRAPRSVSLARLDARARRRTNVSDGRVEIFDAFAQRFEPVDELPDGEHIVVDTSRPLVETFGALQATVDALAQNRQPAR